MRDLQRLANERAEVGALLGHIELIDDDLLNLIIVLLLIVFLFKSNAITNPGILLLSYGNFLLFNSFFPVWHGSYLYDILPDSDIVMTDSGKSSSTRYGH